MSEKEEEKGKRNRLERLIKLLRSQIRHSVSPPACANEQISVFSFSEAIFHRPVQTASGLTH